MNRKQAIALGAVKFVFGVSMAVGFATYTPPASADTDDPGIVMDHDGQLRDCTVIDIHGNRADWHDVCDLYWSKPA